MGSKTNRLKGRLRIEQERAKKAQMKLAEWEKKILAREAELAKWRDELAARHRDLDRSVMLRIRATRDFRQPCGDAFGLNIVLYPNEYRYMSFREGPPSPMNISNYAGMRGHEAGKQIAQVIERCLKGELEDFVRVG